MPVTKLFDRRYVWLMDHSGRWYLSLADRRKPSGSYVIDETLTRCSGFPPDIDWNIHSENHFPKSVREVAYALCEEYLQTNGDGNA